MAQRWVKRTTITPPGETLTRLLHIPHRSMKARRYELTVDLSETRSSIKGDKMRCNFETRLSVDIDVNDDALRAAFIEMVLQAARAMYGPTVMLAKNAPTISVSMSSRQGKVDLPLFTVTQESDDEED